MKNGVFLTFQSFIFNTLTRLFPQIHQLNYFTFCTQYLNFIVPSIYENVPFYIAMLQSPSIMIVWDAFSRKNVILNKEIHHPLLCIIQNVLRWGVLISFLVSNIQKMDVLQYCLRQQKCPVMILRSNVTFQIKVNFLKRTFEIKEYVGELENVADVNMSFFLLFQG